MPTLCEVAGVPAPRRHRRPEHRPHAAGPGRPERTNTCTGNTTATAAARPCGSAIGKRFATTCRKAPSATPELYNLASDPGETTNVAAQHPDLAAKAAALHESRPQPELGTEVELPATE